MREAISSEPRPLGRARLALLGAVAAVLHGGFDAASAFFPPATPPYLRMADMPDAFQTLSPVAVSVAASCVSGLIAVIALIATATARRRRLALAATVTGFWVFSAVLTRLVWLDTPWSVALVGILAGVPRGVVVAAVLASMAER